jgi:hypothetical protein
MGRTSSTAVPGRIPTDKAGNGSRPAAVGITVWPIRNLVPGIWPTEIEVFVEVFSMDSLLDNRILNLGAMSSV